MRKDFILGVDLAKRYDRTAFTLLERTPLDVPVPEDEELPDTDPLLLRLAGCYQPPRGTAYEVVAKYAGRLVNCDFLRGRTQVVLDLTGVGQAVLELFYQQPWLDELTWSVTITPGQRVSRRAPMEWGVPKKDLVDAVLINLQRKRLVACPLDGWDMEVCRKQMFAFKRKVDPKTLYASFEAIDEATHDDAVLSLCLGCWLSGQIPLDDHGEDSEIQPYTILPGAAPMPRFADTWRPTDDPATHRQAGPGPTNRHPELPPMPNHPPTTRDRQ